MKKITLQEKFKEFSETWSPRILGSVNDSHVKIFKAKGEFTWHKHENEDELFLVISGELKIRFRDREVILGPGELLIIPRGVEHCPYAEDEAHVLLVEPKTTVNTGNVRNHQTVEAPKSWN